MRLQYQKNMQCIGCLSVSMSIVDDSRHEPLWDQAVLDALAEGICDSNSDSNSDSIGHNRMVEFRVKELARVDACQHFVYDATGQSRTAAEWFQRLLVLRHPTSRAPNAFVQLPLGPTGTNDTPNVQRRKGHESTNDIGYRYEELLHFHGA